ncbi:hypothetical protein LO82_03625 [Vibrio vulnificus]|nr:hypothetical protein LO82_03625 [Vibrio vulnificus]HDY8063645.1 hypothetical protein [Vibrio vulnificus]
MPAKVKDTGGSRCHILEALVLKGIDSRITFVCIGCGQPLRPHKASRNGKQAAHFEHYAGHKPCNYSQSPTVD